MVFKEIKAEDREKISPTCKGSDIVWHEDVKLFSAWDEGEGGAFFGHVFLTFFQERENMAICTHPLYALYEEMLIN